jgi:mono/diheme cytochrome c family protein
MSPAEGDAKVSKTKITVALLVLALGGVAYVAVSVWRHGFSAREKPSRVEAFLARHARRIATPAGAKGLKNPYPATTESLAEAREHFVEHCSTCHGLDGRGDTPIGRNLYPKAPDMTDAETEQLTDGELFYIISNGVRFTGMPAWGSEDSPESIWDLVGFIRRLPSLTPEELKLMQQQATGRESGAEGPTHEHHTHAPGAAHHDH